MKHLLLICLLSTLTFNATFAKDATATTAPKKAKKGAKAKKHAKKSDNQDMNNVTEAKNEDALHSAIGNNEAVVITITMNGCGHCENLKKFVKGSLQKDYPDVKFMIIETNNAPTLTKSEKAQGFPHTVLFENGKKTGVVQGADTAKLKDQVAGMSERKKMKKSAKA